MKRITVTFYDEIYEKLENRVKEKNEKSVSNSVRELVDLGLKLEEAAKKNQTQNQENPINQMLEIILKQLKSTLQWSLETRLLARYLVENLPSDNKSKAIEILEKYKESANSFVNGMLGEGLK